MAKYDFEEEFSDSDNNDDILRDEIAALSTACLPDFSDDDDDDDDLELVRGIKEQYGGGADISKPLSLKPLYSLPPVASDDDEDDFETLRAIQRRFSQYSGASTTTNADGDLDANLDANVDATETKSDNCINKSLQDDDAAGNGMHMGNDSFDVCRNDDVEQDPCDTAENQEGSGHTSSFPKVAQTFIEAIKKNRLCQKFIRSKLLHIEARMEETKELQKRVKTLRDFQVQCKKKISRALSQKHDARIQLISAPKQRANAKVTDKNVSALCCGPLENSHVARYRTTLTKFPLIFHREKWSKEERENLEKGIIQQFQEMLLNKSADNLSAVEEPGYANGLDSIISSITNIDITPEMIQDFSVKVNWEQLAAMYLPRRTGAECEARWVNFENRLINRENWTPMEDKHLLFLIQQNGLHKWNYIAEKLKTNRTPFQCLARYERSLNASVLRRDWSEDEDAQLRSAVESFGEGNWQAVASALEGRTGTQCSNRWNKTLHPTRQRVGKWSDHEDKRLKVAVTLFGHKSWHRIAQFVPGRTQVQCRERWVNVLDPSLNRGVWTEEEDLKLKEAIIEHGYCWSKVAACVHMRTDNQCRRRWKRLFPHEVPLLRAARSIQKAALISNFVDRESERPALGPNDFVPLCIEGSTNALENDNVPQKRKKSRKMGESNPTGETAQSSTLKEPRSRKCRKRVRSSEVKMTNDCYLESNIDGDKVVKKRKMSDDSGSKENYCSRGANNAAELEKITSKRKSNEAGETNTWDMPINIRSRRPRGVRSKAICLTSDSSVVQATGFNDISTRTMSGSGKSNDPKMLHDQSMGSDSQLKISGNKEVRESNIAYMASKQSSYKLQPGGSLTETALETSSSVGLDLRTSSSDSAKTHYGDTEGLRKKKIAKKQHKKSKLHPDQTKEWEDLPLAVIFSEAVACLQRRKSSNCHLWEMSLLNGNIRISTLLGSR